MRVKVDGPVSRIIEEPDLVFLGVHGFRYGVERAQEGAHFVEERDVPL